MRPVGLGRLIFFTPNSVPPVGGKGIKEPAGLNIAFRSWAGEHPEVLLKVDVARPEIESAAHPEHVLKVGIWKR